MKFVDYVKIDVRAGDGGRGCISFRREKYIPRGGPDGGDGGKGGDVIVKADSHLSTLLDHKYKKHYRSKNGGHGMGKNKHGRDADNLVIKVPIGTVVKDQRTQKEVADLDREEAEVIVAKGGRGGKGNAHFKTAVRQAPRFAQDGEKGEELAIILELKLLADVGLIGMPNAGKSTFISSVSAARPRIADYPFTTLVPNLGVVKMGDFRSFIVADIPGIIEDASKGAGLGLQFLRHAERTSFLLHLVDISAMMKDDPIDVFETINRELSQYSSELSKKEEIVVGTKMDIAGDKKRLKKLDKYCKKNHLPFFAISSITREGIDQLIQFVSNRLKDMKKI